MVNTSDSGSKGRGFEPHSGRRVVSLSKTYLLVIPRKRWLRPNMTEKLFTGTLSIKLNQLRRSAANDKIFKLFFLHPFLASTIYNNTIKNKFDIG